MKVVAAYLLAVLGGNTSPSAEDIKALLGCIGIDSDDEKIGTLVSQVEDKDITELIAAGREKLASVPSGCGVSVAATATGGGGAAPATAEAKKEEKVEEKEDSDDEMGCFSLFD